MKKIFLTGLVLLFLPSLLSAHVYMSEAVPSDGDKLSTAPEKIRLTFAASIEPAFSRIDVFDPSGKKVSKKASFLEDDTVMEVKLGKSLRSGIYTVKILCVSMDGHKQKLKYTFTLK